jgi:hypothetical protein
MKTDYTVKLVLHITITVLEIILRLLFYFKRSALDPGLFIRFEVPAHLGPVCTASLFLVTILVSEMLCLR